MGIQQLLQKVQIGYLLLIGHPHDCMPIRDKKACGEPITIENLLYSTNKSIPVIMDLRSFNWILYDESQRFLLGFFPQDQILKSFNINITVLYFLNREWCLSEFWILLAICLSHKGEPLDTTVFVSSSFLKTIRNYKIWFSKMGRDPAYPEINLPSKLPAVGFHMMWKTTANLIIRWLLVSIN